MPLDSGDRCGNELHHDVKHCLPYIGVFTGCCEVGMQDSDDVLVVKLSQGHQFTTFVIFVLDHFFYANYLPCLNDSNHENFPERTFCNFHFISVSPMQLS